MICCTSTTDFQHCNNYRGINSKATNLREGDGDKGEDRRFYFREPVQIHAVKFHSSSQEIIGTI